MRGGVLHQYCAELEMAKTLFSIVNGWVIGANVDEHEINVSFKIDNLIFFMDIDLAPQTVTLESVNSLITSIDELTSKEFVIHENEQLNIDPYEKDHAVYYVHVSPMWKIVLRSSSVIV